MNGKQQNRRHQQQLQHSCMCVLSRNAVLVCAYANCLHTVAAAVVLMQGVPRCVLQLVAVGCVFIATKHLEVCLTGQTIS
jgi:hypothetical protein